MSFERKTIDDIARLLTELTGDERLVGRDDSGDFKATTLTLVQYVAGQIASISYSIKEIDDADYTITDIDAFGCYIFKNLTADRTLTLPTLADNNNKKFTVINASGSYDVDCTPEDRGSGDIDYVNDWKLPFPITEKGGEIEFKGLSDKWLVIPLNDACIYEVSTETADTGLALDGAWDDVDGMALTVPFGRFLISAKGIQFVEDSSFPWYLIISFGIGSISGNNAPNISKLNDYQNLTGLAASNSNYRLLLTRQISTEEYISSGITLYMKAAATSDESPVTSHIMYGTTNAPMYIKAVRTY